MLRKDLNGESMEHFLEDKSDEILVGLQTTHKKEFMRKLFTLVVNSKDKQTQSGKIHVGKKNGKKEEKKK